jgi:hydrogenase maturation protease
MSSTKSTLIIGIGNPLRSDDGVAAYACQQLEEIKAAGVTIMTTLQLDIGLAEDLAEYRRILFIDASLDEPSFSIQPVLSGKTHIQNISHQIHAITLAALTRQLFMVPPAFYLCAIGVYDFTMGGGLSDKALGNARAAITRLREWILEDD